MLASPHPQQDARLRSLERYGILDTDPEPAFDDIVDLIAAICEVPVALVSFVQADRQWFKAETGTGLCETPIEQSICSHAILEDDLLEVSDTWEDPRTADNPLCRGEAPFRFYAGAVLRDGEGLPLGTLCVLDRVPRRLNQVQRKALTALAGQVMRELELRLALRREELLRREIDHRVKNSLTSIGALISLQSARTVHAETRDALDSVRQRVAALTSLHAELHDASDGVQVRLDRFLRRAADAMRGMLGDGVSLQIDVEPATLDSRQANSIALLVNEFVANAAKHAFPGGRRGRVMIRGRHGDDGYLLDCSDDGVGDAETIAAFERSDGLGMRIISASAASIPGKSYWSAGEPGLRLLVEMGALDRA